VHNQLRTIHNAHVAIPVYISHHEWSLKDVEGGLLNWI